MTRHLHEPANALLYRALDLPPSDRQQFIADACAGEPELLDLVRELLSRIEQLDEFLESPLDRSAEPKIGPLIVPRPGEAVGAWRVIRELGRDGMDVILLVERAQGQGAQSGTMKVAQACDPSADTMARFQREHHDLSRLNHPGVARVADAGSTADGRPFFVVERTEGAPIDQYCADLKLDLRQRVALFATACHAMHHVHQHLVIHRGLKPGNILVGPDGAVRLADVGIAGDAGTWTAAPLFASPEQLADLPLSTSSDVYSLGAILYGLLSGRSPNTAEAAGIIHIKARPAPVRASDAVAQAAERHYPPLPELAADEMLKPDAKLAAQLRGALDDILLKAIDPQPERRYASADALADDLERFLAREPIEAAPPGTERRRVQPKRSRAGSAVAGIVAIALVAGAGAALWHARESDKARAVAEKRLAAVLAESRGPAVQNAPKSERPAPAQAEPQDSLPALRKELAMREMIAAKETGNAQEALGVADAHTAIGNALLTAMDYPEAEREFTAARKAYAAQAQANPSDAALKAGLIDIELARAGVQNLQRHGRDAVQTLAALHKLTGGERDARIALLDAHIQPRGTAAQAFTAAEQALAELLPQYESDPNDVAKLRKSAQAWQAVAEVGVRADQTETACRYLGLAAKRYQEFAASNRLNAIDKWRQGQVQELRKGCN